jgi:hypothetical protein
MTGGEGEDTAARRLLRFIVVGAAATASSLIAFQAARNAGASPFAAVAVRLLAALPILYLGYSRWMLADTLTTDQERLGPIAAEARMLLRVALAVCASIVVKLLLDPILIRLCVGAWGAAAAPAVPLVADMTYGPAANYLVLHRKGRAGQ